MEYLNKRLEELTESVFSPIWRWVMDRSWTVRASLLLLLSASAGAATHPDLVHSLYDQGAGGVRVMVAGPGILPLGPETADRLDAIIDRLQDTIQSDLLTLDAGVMTPFTTAQALAVTNTGAGKGPGPATPTTTAAIDFIRKGERGACFCWTELPESAATEANPFISAWVLLAFSSSGVAVQPDELAYVLAHQEKLGWWPFFEDVREEQYASTYATAWNLIGLSGLYRGQSLPPDMRGQVLTAIRIAHSWLLNSRLPASHWRPYPNLSFATASDSLSGLALHALHQSAMAPGRDGPRLELGDLDRAWLDSLPSQPPPASAAESPLVEIKVSGGVHFDRFAQVKLPWMLAATVDAYPSGTLAQRARALNWIEEAISQDSVLGADSDPNGWWRSELLYALKYVRSHSHPATEHA
jgi:hypothetical protein